MSHKNMQTIELNEQQIDVLADTIQNYIGTNILSGTTEAVLGQILVKLTSQE